MNNKWPINKLNQWLAEAKTSACSVFAASTSDNLRPATRVAELGEILDDGLIIKNQPDGKVAICIYWMDMGRQIRVEGEVKSKKLNPRAIEFWQEKPFRLHERDRYEITDRGWISNKLYP